jgi:ketosteroid isomerase-like protein
LANCFLSKTEKLQTFAYVWPDFGDFAFVHLHIIDTVMRKFILFICVLAVNAALYAQNPDEAEIRRMLDEQIVWWNQGDLDKFMQGYWKNDSLMFVGKSGVTYGYENTLQRYKKSYPDQRAMGKLKFDVLHVTRVSSEYYFVVAKYMLERTDGNLEGHYTLLLKKIDGRWKVVCDHSS